MANRVLIITGDTVEAEALQKVLGGAQEGAFIVEWVKQLSEGLDRLRAGGIDAIIVELALHDSQGIDTFDQVLAAAPHTPILILSAANDDNLVKAKQHGAQGSLSKNDLDNSLVPQSLHNLIKRRAVEETCFLEKARAEIILNSISDAVISTDMAGNVDYLNIAAETMTGWSREEAHGHPIGEVMRIIDGDTRKPKPNPIDLVLQQDEAMALTAGTILIRRDGHEAAIEDSAAPIHDWDGKMSGAVIVFHDVTASQAMASKMAHLAQHDSLTNLPNRVLLNDRVEQAISLAKRHGTHLAVLFLDLDNFKHINDSLGHSTGDKLLQSVANRLRACVRASDTVSRQGGDEFVVLVTEDRLTENAVQIADKILAALAAPHIIGEHELHVTTSIGISVYPVDGQDAEALFKNADTAMYSAKEKGRNNYQFFKDEMNLRSVERLAMEAALRSALQRQEFVLHYQPKVKLETGAMSGVEALLRWMHPKRGLVLPGEFMPVAENCGLMIPIGRWVLREACTQVKCWQDAGLSPHSIAVNISAPEFCAKNFIEDVRAIMIETGLDPYCLHLEITESVLMRDAEASIDILKQLKKLGVQVAVDDFGTGFSNLSYLARFPIDILKIAPSFVRDISSAASSGIIASAVIAMATSLKQVVVAEGVEDQLQWAFLKVQHCDEGQGYLFGRALAAEPFTALLVSGLAGVVTKAGDHPGATRTSRFRGTQSREKQGPIENQPTMRHSKQNSCRNTLTELGRHPASTPQGKSQSI
ncbi:putative bifunctional diguanylate cyclase/phosphodiesterase [Desulfobulbus alkaliphilus]|uniref:putative bifunctional diguanylate cyclase/phosphodiesterase n=1 Tax=Desulfobulbus alkaliphilus TaxID=869814 RepID=UPI001962A916|nr:EAL domain-containing protein [Desulfobulbus alkaliphilus]MBM9537911.1 EAL domain-containing protein [Desulfobulbus alkaliphilus]